MSDEFVSEEELTQERTAAELARWIDEKSEEIARKPGGKEAVRMRRGLCKVLVEEVFALSIFAEHVYGGRSDVKFRPVIGNQNYDALIFDYSDSPNGIEMLEITQAHEGENEFLRRLLLQRQKWTPAWGSIKKTGTKNTGITLETSGAVLGADEFVSQQSRLIRVAFERKLKKKYGPNTSLLIMFEDLLSLDEPEVRDGLINFFYNEVAPKSTSFKKIYIVGWSKQSIISKTSSLVPSL